MCVCKSSVARAEGECEGLEYAWRRVCGWKGTGYTGRPRSSSTCLSTHSDQRMSVSTSMSMSMSRRMDAWVFAITCHVRPAAAAPPLGGPLPGRGGAVAAGRPSSGPAPREPAGSRRAAKGERLGAGRPPSAEARQSAGSAGCPSGRCGTRCCATRAFHKPV